MRVLLIVEAANAGTGRHVCDLMAGLCCRQHDVWLVYSPMRMDRRFERALEAMPPGRAIAIPMRRAPGPWDVAAVLTVWRRFHGANQFDVVHGHSAKGGAIARLLPQSFASVCVYTPHAFRTLDPGLGSSGRRMYGLFESLLSRRGHAAIAVTQHERMHALGLGLSEESVFCVPNGAHFEPRPNRRAKSLEAPLSVGFVGRMTEQKGPDFALEAFELAIKQHALSGLEMIMVGEGPLRPALEAKARAMGVAEQVKWVGDTDASGWLDHFDVLLAPSRYEGMPYLILEAMAAGTPVVAAAVGGLAEIIEEGVSGCLVEPGNVPALASALARLVKNHAVREQIALKAIERVARFGLDKMVDQTVDVYEVCLSRLRG